MEYGTAEQREDQDNVIIRRVATDLVRCPVCMSLQWIYIFENGSMKTIHKHGGEPSIPRNYVPLNGGKNDGERKEALQDTTE